MVLLVATIHLEVVEPVLHPLPRDWDRTVDAWLLLLVAIIDAPRLRLLLNTKVVVVAVLPVLLLLVEVAKPRLRLVHLPRTEWDQQWCDRNGCCTR